MKNNFLLLTARCIVWGLFLPCLSVAQSTLGIQGGLHLSDATVNGPTPFVASSQGNYFVGLTGRKPVGARWAIGSDVQYTKRGFFLNQVRSVSESRQGFQLMYVDLAAKMEYHIFKNISVQLGAYTGYRLAEYVQVAGSEQWVRADLPLTEQWDIGLQTGVVAHFQRWSAFARYTHALTPVSQVEITDEVERVKIYNRGLQMGVSYALFSRQ